jgi:hypothetical protein
MKLDTYSSAIAANAVLQELIAALKIAKVLDERQAANVWVEAARKLNASNDPSFKAAGKAVSALYNR